MPQQAKLPEGYSFVDTEGYSLVDDVKLPEGYSFIDEPAPESKKETGDTWRGAKTAAKQLPQLGYGLVAGAGAVAESAFGEGGISTGIKSFGVKKYKEIGADIAKDAKETDSLTYSWDQAKQGNYGAMVDWLQYGIGYGGVQALEALASGGIGAAVGKATLKGTAEHLASGMVAKETARIAATTEGAALTADAVGKMAVANVAAKIGAAVGVGAQAYGMEGGEIGGGLAEESVKRGTTLTGAEIAKGLGATLAAGSLEFVGDKLGVDIMIGKSKLFKPAAGMIGLGGKVTRAGVAAAAAIPVGAGAEYFQTGLEEYGQSKEANILPWNQSEEAQRQAFDAAGLGGVGGGGMAVVGGLISKPQPAPQADIPPPPTQPSDRADLANVLADPRPMGEIVKEREAQQLKPTGTFGQVDEFANLAAQERADIDQRRAELAQQQALQREAELESADARVLGAQQAGTRLSRLQLLDTVYANPSERTPGMTFLAQLEANFPNNPNPTPEEKRIILQRESAHQAFKDIPEPPAQEQQPREAWQPKEPVQRTEKPRSFDAQKSQVDEYVSSGFKPINGARFLVNTKGKKLKLTEAQREYVKSLPKEAFKESATPAQKPISPAAQPVPTVADIQQGEVYAETVRSDEGQIRPRSAEGQQEVQRGTIEGGSDLQQSAQEAGIEQEALPVKQDIRATLKPIIEQLIKRKAAAKQINLGGHLGIAINSAKKAAEEGIGKASVFKKYAKMFKGKDEETHVALMSIADALEPVVMNIPAPKAKVELAPEQLAEHSAVREEAKQLGIGSHAFGGIDTLVTAIANKKNALTEIAYEAALKQANEVISDSNKMADIEEAAHAIHGAADSSTDSLIGWTKAYEQAIKDFQPKEVKDEGTQGNAGQTATGTAAEGDTQHGAEVGNEGNAATQGEVAKPAAESKPADTQFANNKIFTQSAVDAARARLKKKLGNVNSGIDPELLQDGLTLAGAYIEAGARSFAAYSKAMIDDLGDAIKPYLRSLYESVRHYPGLDTDGMTTSVDIDAIATHQEAAAPAEVKKEEKKPASLPETSGNKINTPPVISEIVKRLAGEGYKGIAEARAHLSDLTGTPIKTGTVEAKQADEALELAAVMRAKEIVRKGIARGQSSQAIYDALVDLYENKMPNLNVRTSTSVEQQAYSTPVPLAYIASRLAGINMESVVAEPTAGNGALLIVTDPKLVFANELNADRATALRSQGYANVSEEDGTTWSPPQKVDSVIANPPFGVVRDDKGVSKSFKINERYTTNEIDHAISLNSLKAMKDDGTAVLILGGIKSDDVAARSDAYNSKAKRAFYLTLYSEYIVTDHFTVSGSMYAKQGAAWPVDVIVIKGRGKSSRSLPAVDVPRIINDYVELGKELKNEQSSSNSQSVGILAEQGEGKPAKPSPNGAAVGGGGNGGITPNGGRGELLPQSAGNVERTDTAGNRKNESIVPVSDLGRVNAGLDTEQSPHGLVRADTKEEAETSGQVHYVPTSQANNIGTLVPKNMGTAIKAALAALKQRIGNIDNYVAKQLDYKLNDLSKYFSAEQVDALGLAIDNISNGGGFIIGDQCIAGDTRIYDPVEDTYTPIRELAEAGNPINVLSLTPIGLIPMGAYAPFLKGEDDLYKVILDDGREISVTSGHRFLSQDGWSSISDGLSAGHFLASSVGRSLSSLEFSRLAHDEGVQHSTETPQDCLARCFSHRHQSSNFERGTDLLKDASILKERIRHSNRQRKYLPQGFGLVPEYVFSFGGNTGWLRIVSIEFIGRDKFYDMWVPDAENYVAEGLINHNTGVGKGRIVAGLIKYAIKNGKTPIFVTEKPNLYGDMIRDLTDIGMHNVKPFMTNSGESIPLDQDAMNWLDEKEKAKANGDKSPARYGKFLKTPGNTTALMTGMMGNNSLGAHDAIFTTYSQMQTVKGNPTVRMEFINRFADGSIVIFDESHNAGGEDQSGKARGLGENTGTNYAMNRATFARTIAGKAHGVFYSSATYAKRPSVMSLYFRTSMAKAVKDIKQLGAAISAGGVPLQQVVATMLAKAGQYMRRERSFAGVEYNVKEAAVDKSVAENASTIFRAINHFDELKRVGVAEMAQQAKHDAKLVTEDRSTGGAGVESQNFTSVLHNNIAQLLLTLKAKSAVEEAVASLKAGNKVVLTLSNTMGSFIEEYVTENDLKSGDPIDLTYADLLLRYLEKSRLVTIKDAFGGREKHRLTDDELGSQAAAFWNSTKDRILGMDFRNIPISPIDYVKNELAKAGFKTGEITGRQHIIDYSGKVPVYRQRPASEKSIGGRMGMISKFNNGQHDAIVLNQSGATGLSLHASSKFKDQHQRHMIIMQAEANIDTHMQMLGRVHRTGQIITPKYTQLSADIPAEKRPAAVLAKKMASLNANTTASAKSAFTAEDSLDFMNEYGDQVASELMLDDPELNQELGEPFKGSAGEAADDDGVMRKVTGRIPLLPLAKQEEVYQKLEDNYRELLAHHDALGTNKLEAKTLNADAKTKEKTEVFKGSETSSNPFEQSAYAESVDMKKQGRSYTQEQVIDMLKAELISDSNDISTLQKRGAQLMNDTRSTLQADFNEYRREVLDDIEDNKRRDATGAKLHEQIERVMQFIRSNHVGKTVIVTIDGNALHGVITKIVRREGTKNPAAAGSWKVTIAVADGMRHITLPLTKFTHGFQSIEEGVPHIGALDSSNSANTFKLFDTAQSSSREYRTIITGNILAGFGKFNGGQIVHFTDHEGNMRQGILMPAKFDLEAAMSSGLIPLTPDQAARFLKEGTGGRVIKSDDGIVRIGNVSNGDYLLRVPSSKAEGGKYFLHKSLIAAAGTDFIKVGNDMRVTLNSNRDLRSVLDALSAMNVVMGTDSFRDEANKIAGDKAEQAKGDNAKFSRAISGITNFTPSQITESLRQSPFVGKIIDKLLARGEKGRRGGVIVAKDIEDAQRLFEEKTGRELGDDVLKSVKRDQTDTPEFKKWFGNSKVVDADGKPMVVYHGTKGDFTSFDPTHLGKTTLAESAKKGFFFAGNPDTSAQYSLAASPIEHRVEGERWQQEAISAAGIRHSAYRALKDAVGVVKTKPWEPVRIEADAPIETVRLFDAFQSAKSIERAAKEKVENYFDSASERNTRFMVGRVTDEDINEQVTYPVFLSIKNPLVVDFENNGRQITFDELIDQAKSAGNDGVVIKNVADPIPGDTIYVAFEPTQIKSAIGNNGQFDPKNPDIHYSQDGVVQGLFDRSSGISFLIASHLTPETAPAVLLHEVAHGIFTPEMLQEGVKLIDLRDSPLIPKATREFLQQVYEKIEAGKRLISEYGNATEHNLQESAPYLIEHALLKGRQAGFSAIDSAFFDFILSKFGKRISDLMKNWVAKVRITLRKHGIITKIYVDDFIALAQAGLKQAVRGEVNADGDVVSGSRAPKNPDISHSKGIVYEIQPETISVLPDSGANLTELRRAAAKLDAPEKGITFRIEDGKAIVTGPAKTRVPDRFKRFANEHGLVLSVRQRTPMSGWGTNYLGDGKTSQISTGTYAEKPMPIAYRESGALYFGEIGEQRESGSNTQFSIAPISPAAPERAGKDTPEPKIPLVSEPIPGKRFTLQGETQAQRLQRKSQDAQIRWKNVQDQVVSQGGTVTEETDVYKAMERYPGIVAGKMLEFGRDVQEPFLKRIVAAGTTLDEVSLLAYAEHAPERNTGIAKINPLFPNDGTPGKSGSGMTDQDALDIIDYIKSLPNANEIFALAENLREIADNRLDKLVKEGAMSQEQANAYRAKYKKYVPLKGFELVDESGIPQENGKGLSTGKKIDMRALGRKSRAGQIAQNIFRDYEFAIATVEKSVVGKVAAAFIKANPDSALWSVDEAPKKPAYAKGGSVHQVAYFGSVVAEFVHPVDANAYAEELRYKADVESKDVTVESHRLHPEGVVIQREAPFDPEAEIRFLQDGKEMRVQLTDPLMTRAYNNIWHPQVSHALRVLNDYNVWLRQMYTQKNPAWFALNIFKDIPSAAIYTVGEYGAKVASKVLGNIPKSLKAAWNFHHNKSAGPEMDGIIKMYLENGGYTGFAYVGDIEAQTQKLEGMIHRYTSWGETAEKFKKGQYKKGLHDAGVKLLNSRFIAWIEALNTTFENTTRLAVFKAAIDSGLSPKQAASLAKNASTNFNRRGEWGPNMNAAWLFSNAGIQGTRNVGHALFFSKHKGQVWVLMSGFIALGIMAGLMSDDDDDLIDDEKRGKALIFKFGNAQVSIPMPYGFGFFAGFGQLIVQAMKHPDEREKIAIRMADLTMSHFSPFGNPYAGSQAKIEGLANLTPTIGRPVVNTMVNISPFGGMMYPEDRYGNKPDSEKEWRATKGTVYDITAKWLNRVTGGDQAQEGLVSVSPESLKLGVSTLFGGAGRLATDSASLLFDIPNENVKAKNIPVVKYFYQKVDTDNYTNRFYRDSRQASDAYKTFRAYVKSGDVKSAESYLAEEHLMISMGKLVRRYSEAISEIRNAEDEIKIDKRLTAGMKKVRLAKLDAKRKAIAEKFNSQLKKM